MAKGTRRHWYDSTVTVGLLAVGLAVVTVIVVSFVNPWPAALLIRAMFEKGAQDTVAEMLPYVPKSGVDAHLDVAYGTSGVDTTLDVFTPAGSTGALDHGRLDPRRRLDLGRQGETSTPTCRSSPRTATRPWPQLHDRARDDLSDRADAAQRRARLPRRARSRVQHRPRPHRASRATRRGRTSPRSSRPS